MAGRTGETEALYGRFGCDPNENLIQAMMKKMKRDYDLDVVLLNGDIVGHDIAVKPAMNLTNEQVEEHYEGLKRIQTRVSELLNSNFPGAVVLPTLGNNDVKWHYQVPNTTESKNDFYGHVFENLIEKFQQNQNLNLEEIETTFMEGGYY